MYTEFNCLLPFSWAHDMKNRIFFLICNNFLKFSSEKPTSRLINTKDKKWTSSTRTWLPFVYSFIIKAAIPKYKNLINLFIICVSRENNDRLLEIQYSGIPNNFHKSRYLIPVKHWNLNPSCCYQWGNLTTGKGLETWWRNNTLILI